MVIMVNKTPVMPKVIIHDNGMLPVCSSKYPATNTKTPCPKIEAKR